MIIKPENLKKLHLTDNSGSDSFNPKVRALPSSYKLALYLGYNLKWHLFTESITPFIRDYKYVLTPIFKKSKTRYYPWDYAHNWNTIINEVIPKLKEDGMLTDEIKESIFESNQEQTVRLILTTIDDMIPEIESPFLNVSIKPNESLIWC